jgi:plasmid maintenance system antidote protein VapI
MRLRIRIVFCGKACPDAIHPGEILAGELAEIGVTPSALALRLALVWHERAVLAQSAVLL